MELGLFDPYQSLVELLFELVVLETFAIGRNSPEPLANKPKPELLKIFSSELPFLDYF